MSRFTDATYVITDLHARGRPVVRLTSPMVYEVDYLGSGWLVTAPVGFTTDMASLPLIPKWMMRFAWGRWLSEQRSYVALLLARASVPHDACRRDKKRSKWLGDYVFWEAMGVDRVPMPLRLAATLVVLLNFTRD